MFSLCQFADCSISEVFILKFEVMSSTDGFSLVSDAVITKQSE